MVLVDILVVGFGQPQLKSKFYEEFFSIHNTNIVFCSRERGREEKKRRKHEIKSKDISELPNVK